MDADFDRRVCAFLALTLEIWGVEGSVDAASPAAVAVVTARDGAVRVLVVRASSDDPFRWYLCRGRLGEDGKTVSDGLCRPCGSIAGVLAGLRRMLDLRQGAATRVARAIR